MGNGARPVVGIFGGSGLYDLFPGESSVVTTPYGPPSDQIVTSTVGHSTVLFLPRHGRGHAFPPHKVNYRANVDALASGGATGIISVTAVGSLSPDIAPGDLVVCDQFIDATHGRDGTFFDDVVHHTAMSDPFCPSWRAAAVTRGRRLAQGQGATVHDGGCVVTVNGPRYSTRAESRMYRAAGADLIGMTQCPEVALIRERHLCSLIIAVVTDRDAGDGNEEQGVTHDAVVAVMGRAMPLVRSLVEELVTLDEAPLTGCLRCLE